MQNNASSNSNQSSDVDDVFVTYWMVSNHHI
jgi:hypothetical protein